MSQFDDAYAVTLQSNTKLIMKDERSKKTVLICGGSKGGVGKSLLAGSICDVLLGAKVDVTLADCDCANADAVLWCGPLAQERHIRVPLSNQWDPLLNAISDNDAPIYAVNMGAGDAPLFVNEGDIFRRVATEEGWRVVLAYMLSPAFGSIRPLLPVTEAVSGWAEIVIFKNSYYPDDHWVLWEKVAAKGGKEPIREIVLKKASEKSYPLLPGRAILDAHQPGWTSLRSAEEQSHGAYHYRIADYRAAVGRIAAELKLL